jgi:xanthine dehydrogenase YagS FAD-binding subunit
MKNVDYVLARTAAEAAAASAKPGAMLKGGGTDLIERMKEGVARPDSLVNLLSVKEIYGIAETEGVIRIGAAATLADVARDELLKKAAQGLADAAHEAATPQVRNRGTVGGNLCQRPRCWYFRNDTYKCSKKGGEICYSIEGENKYHAIFENTTCNIVHPSNLAPSLWSLDADIEIAEATGAESRRKSIPIGEFWVRPEEDISRENILKPGQVITAVSFKRPAAGTGTSYVETREKDSFDWALTAAACRVTLDQGKVKECRVVVSAVAPTPMRLKAVEEMIAGKSIDDALAKAAGEKALEGATPLRDNGYKVRLLAVTVARALRVAADRAAKGAK